MKVSEKTMAALELPRILTEAARQARSTPGAELVRAVRPLQDASAISERFDLIAELRRMRDQARPFGIAHFEDIRPLLAALRHPGSSLEGVDLLTFIPVLTNIETVLERLDEESGDESGGHDESGEAPAGELPALREFFQEMSGSPGLLSDLERSIGPEGEVLDTASSELKRLRDAVRALDGRISRRLTEITREPEIEVFLQDSFVTKRSGRWVVPVRMDSKGMVKGVVHDVSRTGETAFMEPLEIIGMSNELENLTADARAEEIKVLGRLSDVVRLHSELISMEFDLLLQLDVLNALSVLAERLGAEAPAIGGPGELRLLAARHPLLMLLRGGGEGAKVVPLDVELVEGSGVMIITGPNAGGKTISIKTVGLLMIMAASGIPIPARAESVLPLGAGSLLVDIGDEQSIEENLSTFTAHARSIGDIVRQAGEGSLVLMDELGTGTDPLQGSAIGCGVLSSLSQKGALVIATTHLTDIVAFVHRRDGMVNASMEFDLATMTPLYRLVPGEPGQSHAIEAAERSGMPADVIEFARDMAGSERLELEDMLRELKESRARYERDLKELENERSALGQRQREVEAKLKELEQGRRQEMKKALEEARSEAASIKQKLTALLQEARVSKKPRSAIKAVDRASSDLARRIDDLGDKPAFEPLSVEDIRVGGRVYVSTLGRDAEVASVDAPRGRVRIRVDQKELDVPVSAVGAPRSGGQKPVRTGKVTSPGQVVSEQNIEAEIKLIGLRVEEALDQLEPFLNRASLGGLRSVRVIHGIGTGALRRAVREHLEGHPLVESYAEAHAEGGGAGVTEVLLA